MVEKETFDFEKTQKIFLGHIQEMAPGESVTGFEMVNMMRMNMHFIDAFLTQNPELGELSGPRMGILMRLMSEEDLGNHHGVNPTRLSHYQHVKKNTVSSLISGLEEQGLVERTINTEDKRGFNIRITAAGRELITANMPARIRYINQVTSGLTDNEKGEIIRLLMKLSVSLFKLRRESGICTTQNTVRKEE